MDFNAASQNTPTWRFKNQVSQGGETALFLPRVKLPALQWRQLWASTSSMGTTKLALEECPVHKNNKQTTCGLGRHPVTHTGTTIKPSLEGPCSGRWHYQVPVWNLQWSMTPVGKLCGHKQPTSLPPPRPTVHPLLGSNFCREWCGLALEALFPTELAVVMFLSIMCQSTGCAKTDCLLFN